VIAKTPTPADLSPDRVRRSPRAWAAEADLLDPDTDKLIWITCLGLIEQDTSTPTLEVWKCASGRGGRERFRPFQGTPRPNHRYTMSGSSDRRLGRCSPGWRRASTPARRLAWGHEASGRAQTVSGSPGPPTHVAYAEAGDRQQHPRPPARPLGKRGRVAGVEVSAMPTQWRYP
jgi:hypothetical protein